MTSAVSPTDPASKRSEADDLLSDLAMELVRLPFQGRTRTLHLRALELKRIVACWTYATPDDTERDATLERIVALQRETARWRIVLR